jgi:hypothetical protein
MKYLHKFVEVNYDGEQHIGFVVEEYESFYAETIIKVFLQRTLQTVVVDTEFGKAKILE